MVAKKQPIEKTQESEERVTTDRYYTSKGAVSLRGRQFKGTVIKKFQNRVVIEFERTIYIKKYERYAKRKTKIHARLPESLYHEIHVGDYIAVKECRPLSKIIHFVVTEKITGGDNA